MMPRRRAARGWMPALVLALWCLGTAAHARERITFLGDSITYDGRWVTQVESALRATPQYADADVINLGLPSETVSGLSEPGHAEGRFPRPVLRERLQRVLDKLQPSLVIACYGINDGLYLPLDEDRFAAYRNGIAELKAVVERRGARIVFVTPPLYAADAPVRDAQHYDAVLDRYASWLVQQRSQGWEVIDMRASLRQAIAQARRTDPGFTYAADDIHPDDAGHRFIAEAVTHELWPLLGLEQVPRIAGGKALQLLRTRQALLRDAWLSATGHSRPGLPTGLPLDQAARRAARLLDAYRAQPRTLQWQGYARLDFTVAGHAALLVEPRTAAAGKPWIWRTEFFGHEPQADLALLQRGFHVAYIDMHDLYGGPQAMRLMDALHERLTMRHGLSPAAVLEGFSRGGLFAFNWAARRPGRVAALYVDAPVCDFRNWPGGKGAGPGSAEDWQRLLTAYGLSEAEALAYEGNPVERLAPLAQADIPILAVVGDADEVVPVAENIDVVEQRYRDLGGRIRVIRKPGGRHHPHSLVDPAPIVAFVQDAVAGRRNRSSARGAYPAYVSDRGHGLAGAHSGAPARLPASQEPLCEKCG